jgi:cytochrome c oxidase cbb3-type subunit III
MRLNASLLAACLLFASIAITGAAQDPAAGAGRGAGPQGGAPAPGRQGGRNPGQTFPAQQRPPGDPAVVARGNTLYGIHCRACHGADLRGGDIGGPNLLRSQLALNDQDGELIGPLITEGRQTPGMPAMPPIKLPAEDLRAIAVYIHSVAATMRGQGSPPAGPAVELNVLVGDAAAGEAYFKANCSACHSAAGDLQGIGALAPDPTQLQNLWVSGGRVRGGRVGGARGSATRRQVTAVVTLANGQTVEGRLDRIDDFSVLLTTAEGVQRSFSRTGDVPKVEVRDPLEGHRRLLATYTDRDIHNVTAYLVTLK